MLSEIGSIASIVGLPLTFAALLFAIYHLSKLRGETQAARKASEETQVLMRRESASTDLARVNERLQELIELQRDGKREQALNSYREIRNLLRAVRRQHPNLSQDHRRKVQNSMTMLGRMQGELEALESDIPLDLAGQLNRRILQLQDTLLVELEDYLESN